MKTDKQIILWAIVLLTLAATAVADLMSGGISSDPDIIRLIRVPRVLTAVLAGSALAASGTQMQSVLRNPLADPYIMGISSGAALGAALATMYGGNALGGISLVSASFGGALISAVLILSFSSKFRNSGTLLIFGVMLGFITNAITSILQFTSDAESLKTFYSWSAGSFSNTTWPQIGIMTGASVIGCTIAMFSHKKLDIILFGDEFATMSGADTGRIRITALLSCCIMTGAVTSFCGPLGFIGIVAPHIARFLFGTSSHRTVLPASILIGAVIGTGADLISQIPNTPLPVAGTMALIGIPFIFYLLIRKPSLQ